MDALARGSLSVLQSARDAHSLHIPRPHTPQLPHTPKLPTPREFLALGFKYDNLLMEESAQILEIETFIPMLLQRPEDGRSRLKRVILIGDHHQLPPVVKNMALQKYSNLDQSLFTRFIRLGTPAIELNAQGRARPSLAKLYNWRYGGLGDLPAVSALPVFRAGNPGFGREFQFVDVPDFHGRGESSPLPFFYQVRAGGGVVGVGGGGGRVAGM